MKDHPVVDWRKTISIINEIMYVNDLPVIFKTLQKNVRSRRNYEYECRLIKKYIVRHLFSISTVIKLCCKTDYIWTHNLSS